MGGREREKRGGEGDEESYVKQREREWRTCESETLIMKCVSEN